MRKSMFDDMGESMPSQTTVTCPNCGTEIDISQSLYVKLEQQAKAKLQKEVAEHRAKYKQAMDELKAKEEAIEAQEAKFQKELEKATQARVEAKLKTERRKLEVELKAKIAAEQSEQLEMMRKELAEKSEQVKELNRSKAQIEKLKREKAEVEERAKLEAEKALNEQLEIEREKIQKSLTERSELKLREKEQQLEQLRRQLEEAKRKAEQGSQQMQGEVQELAIEEWLNTHFPFDTVEEIKKGARGADCLQVVNTREMQNCGTIYYESKRTKEFQKNWIEKFKADIREKGADIGVLVTEVLPKDMERMGLVDGVWVCTYEEFKALSSVLREQIVRLAHVTQSQENRSDKMSLLYNYLTSNEFRMQIEAIVEGFTQMQADLDAEKRAMARIWKQREKQIAKVLDNTTALYGSIRGIAGNAIGHIQALELPYFEKETEE
ncbi:DUF2130 domain-containing protein [Hydrogenimonas cancrithermarum]|uniref:Caldesmon n=1 Tax=Hydrogenimonas cancrithermarum TaxID=2993563 RepID=A0ABN6WS28_9BACT|nr:DUF2130 domain-containing protein [Hydrogenimonas cancrithermarum]BDY11742.1 hypothetical protein HCR_00540 [Hydrogenimonas cancrithermarum]